MNMVTGDATGHCHHGGALILAAGSARRFGTDKRLAQLTNGCGVLEQALGSARQAFDNLCVVIAKGDCIRRQLPEALVQAADWVVNERSHLGMGSSLARGIACCTGWDYAFVLLADMPWIKPQTLRALDEQMRASLTAGGQPHVLVRPVCEGRAGHPVGFSASLFASLSQLAGDTGARQLVRAHAPCLVNLVTADAGVLRDIDHPTDLC